MKRKIIWITSLVAVLVLAAFIYFKFYFVFGEGVKAGELNFVVSKTSTSAIQSYEFEFSITDPAVADSLMRCGGKTVELHYKEYLGTLPWRGQQKYIVDEILAVR